MLDVVLACKVGNIRWVRPGLLVPAALDGSVDKVLDIVLEGFIDNCLALLLLILDLLDDLNNSQRLFASRFLA